MASRPDWLVGVVGKVLIWAKLDPHAAIFDIAASSLFDACTRVYTHVRMVYIRIYAIGWWGASDLGKIGSPKDLQLVPMLGYLIWVPKFFHMCVLKFI